MNEVAGETLPPFCLFGKTDKPSRLKDSDNAPFKGELIRIATASLATTGRETANLQGWIDRRKRQ